MERYYELWCLRSRNRLFHSYDDNMTREDVIAHLRHYQENDPDFPERFAFGYEEIDDYKFGAVGALDPVAFLDGREVEI